MADYVTLAQCKEFLGITTTDDDALLATLITGASRAVETYTHRVLALATYTEYFDIDSEVEDMLLPEQYPIVSVVALTSDGSLWEETEEFNVTQDRMTFLTYPEGRFFTKGRRKVVVTYSAGYANIPPDIQFVVNKMVGSLKDTRKIGNYTAETMGDYSYKMSDVLILGDPLLTSILNRYRRIGH